MGGIALNELYVYKTSNEIEDTYITYGLAKILEDNDIEYKIIKQNHRYLIKTEGFDKDEIEWIDITLEDCKMVNSTMSKANKNGQISKMNKYMNQNINEIINYYTSFEQNEDKKMDAIQVGSVFYSLGLRGSAVAVKHKVKTNKRHLSYFGFISASSYTKNKNIEINAVLTPRETKSIYKPFTFGKKNEETGEYEVWTTMNKMSDIEMMARVYLETHIKYKYLEKECEKIIFTKLLPAGNKPLVDKTEELKLVNWSYDLLKQLNFDLFGRKTSVDLKDKISRFVIDKKYSNLKTMINQYSKDNKIMNKKFEEELIDMYSDKIKRIYKNENVQKLAKGFNTLSYNGEGFDIQAKLYSVANEMHIQDIIVKLGDAYKRKYKGSILLRHEEFQEVMNLINDKKDAKIMANAILSGKVFVNFNNKKSNENSKEVK